MTSSSRTLGDGIDLPSLSRINRCSTDRYHYLALSPSGTHANPARTFSVGDAEAGTGAMFVACRLAGLSALESRLCGRPRGRATVGAGAVEAGREEGEDAMLTESEARLRFITSLTRGIPAIQGVQAACAAHARLMRPFWSRNALPQSASPPRRRRSPPRLRDRTARS